MLIDTSFKVHQTFHLYKTSWLFSQFVLTSYTFIVYVSVCVCLLSVKIYHCRLYSFGFNFSVMVNIKKVFLIFYESMFDLFCACNRYVILMFYDYFLYFLHGLFTFPYGTSILLGCIISTLKRSLTKCPSHYKDTFRVV